MSESIPEDILTAARRCYDALGRGSISDSERIARAILAERERAATAALHEACKTNFGKYIAGSIAAAIRTPSTGEET